VLLVVATASILLGTLYPLVLDALGVGKISVGPPYFNSVFVPLTAPLALLLGFGVVARWKQDRFARLFALLRWPLLAAVVLGIAWALLFDPVKVGAAVGTVLAMWVIASSLYALWLRVKDKTCAWRRGRAIP